MAEVALISHEAGRRFILNFRFYCSFHHDEVGLFKCFLFYLEIVNNMRQVSIKISEFNQQHQATMQEVRHKVYLYDSLQPSIYKFVLNILKNANNCSSILQDVEITL